MTAFFDAVSWISISLLVVLSVKALVFVVLSAGHHRAHRASTEQPRSESADLVSVVVPCFNEERTILNCVSGLLAQTHENLEIIIVDDGSTDDTSALGRGLSESYAGTIRYLRVQNGGKAAALNHGIAHAAGRFVVTMDADSILHPDAVRHLMEGFTDPKVGAVGGNVKVANRNRIVTIQQAVEYITGLNLQRRSFARAGCMQVISGSIGAFRTEVLEQVGGYSSDTIVEDMDITVSVAATGAKVAYRPDAIAFTEAPESVRYFLRQRHRWVFGAFQVLSKHRSLLFHGSGGRMGRLGLPFVAVMPWLDVVVSILFVLAVARAIVTRAPLELIVFYVTLSSVQAGLALYAMVIDGDRRRLAIVAFFESLWYGHLISATTVRAGFGFLRRREMSWNPVPRRGRNLALANGRTSRAGLPEVFDALPFIADPVVMDVVAGAAPGWGVDAVLAYTAGHDDSLTARTSGRVEPPEDRSLPRPSDDPRPRTRPHLVIDGGPGRLVADHRRGATLVRAAQLYSAALVDGDLASRLSMNQAVGDAVRWSGARPGEVPWLPEQGRGVFGLARRRPGIEAWPGRGSTAVLTGSHVITLAGRPDALLVEARTSDGWTCYLVPWRRSGGGGIVTARLLALPRSAGQAMAELRLEHAAGWQVGRPGGASDLLRVAVDRMTADRLVIAAARMRQAMSAAAWHAADTGLLSSPDEARDLAIMESTSEIATLMALDVAGRPVTPGIDAVLYRRLLLALADRWITEHADPLVERAREIVTGARRPMPASLRTLPALSALLPHAGFGDGNPLAPSSREVLIDRLLKDTRLQSGVDREAIEVHDALTWRLTSAVRRPSEPEEVLDAAGRLWAFSLLIHHDRIDVAALWARLVLRVPALQTPDMVASARQVDRVARHAVPGDRGLSLRAPIEISLDLTDVPAIRRRRDQPEG